jgi:YD repeat-containing protein
MFRRTPWVAAATSVALAAALAVPTTAAAAATHPTRAAAPDSAWTPPAQVNRTAVGGPAPDTAWHPAVASGGGVTGPLAQAPDCDGKRLGVLPQYPLERFQIDDRLEADVNTSNGDLVLRARDLTVKGTGIDLSIDHVYNSQGPAGALGRGWTLSTGQDVGLTFPSGGDVVLHDPSGACSTFVGNDDGSYAAAPGLRATLSKDTDGSFTLQFGPSGTYAGQTWSFTAQGWLASRADRNGHTITSHYADDGRLASVTDSQGRVTTFSYGNDNRLTKITDPTGTTAARFDYNLSGGCSRSPTGPVTRSSWAGPRRAGGSPRSPTPTAAPGTSPTTTRIASPASRPPTARRAR